MTAYRFIQADKANHSVRMICRVLRVSRAAYYAWHEGGTHTESAADKEVLVHVRAIHRRF